MAGTKPDKSAPETPRSASLYHPGFPLCAADAPSPFDAEDDKHAGALFLYLTHGTGARWTRLFDADQEPGAAAAALKSFRFLSEKGAAMWLLEVVHAASPSKEAGGDLGPSSETPEFPPPGLKRRDWPMQKHVVLADPSRVTRTGARAEVVSYHDTPEDAIAGAKAAAKQHGVVAVAALMREDWPWDQPPKRVPRPS